MENERYFRWALSAVFVIYALVNILANWKTKRRKFTKDYSKTDLRLLKSVIFIEVFVVLIFIFDHNHFGFATAFIPYSFRICGIFMALTGIYLFWYSNKLLGKNYNGTLRINHNHTLVTDGIYQYIRHPIYLSLFVFRIGVFLISSNYLIGISFIFLLSVIVFTRLKKEENMLIEEFGQEYIDYREKTGALLPRINRILGINP